MAEFRQFYQHNQAALGRPGRRRTQGKAIIMDGFERLVRADIDPEFVTEYLRIEQRENFGLPPEGDDAFYAMFTPEQHREFARAERQRYADLLPPALEIP